MPYINVSVTKEMSVSKIQELKNNIGKNISRLPGKTEKVLMLDIEDRKTIFFGGDEQENCAYVDVRVYGKFDFEVKADFTQSMFEIFNRVLGISENRMFLTIMEFETWGTNGNLK